MKFRSLSILTDENVSPAVVSFLRGKKMDVADAKERKWHGKEDEYLLEKAYAEDRFILTHDSDFGTLAINEGKRCHGIIYLRLRRPKVSNVIRAMEQLFMIETEFRAGSLIVVDDLRIRVRLPEKIP
uniref:Predicted nuclease, contains PIN domain, potential toxin-antitoxin system component n=1 Tax=Candidatus Kentrum sp. FW TaxID=2126338 RepID=A0A450SSB3_9GAMM|nr:MAG: Predicted nuclease, contains PIN domain, potential toxin-antitoxin system component [Candidatus Kentron sp. FW]